MSDSGLTRSDLCSIRAADRPVEFADTAHGQPRADGYPLADDTPLAALAHALCGTLIRTGVLHTSGHLARRRTRDARPVTGHCCRRTEARR